MDFLKIDTNEFFRQTTISICSSLEIDRALNKTFRYIRQFMPLDHIILMTPDFGGNKILVLAEAKMSGYRLLDTWFPMPSKTLELIEGDDLPGLMIIDNILKHPIAQHARELLPEDPSVILLRLVVDRKVIGSVTFIAEGKGRYSNDEARMLYPLREPFSVALSNYLRYREVVELKKQLADDNRYLREELQPAAGPRIIGAETGLKDVMDRVLQVAALNSPVLLLGETGTGKELVAAQLHHLSQRREGPFIKVNCGAIPDTLMDSELFGHEKGAFTGAASTKKGRFERAHKGTIFLDEVGELPLEAQVRMLRVLQEKAIERIGGGRTIVLDIRIIAATNRNLERLVGEKRFRKDLFFRLNVFPIVLPPLRERRSDIPLLVDYFVKKKGGELGLSATPVPGSKAIEHLMHYHWPGNVRELENVVERELIICQGKALAFKNLVSPQFNEPQDNPVFETTSRTLDDVIAFHIDRVLSATGGRVAGPAGAAKILGVHPSTLRAKMRNLGIPFGRKPAAGVK